LSNTTQQAALGKTSADLLLIQLSTLLSQAVAAAVGIAGVAAVLEVC
jgi:hypothetical protein